MQSKAIQIHQVGGPEEMKYNNICLSITGIAGPNGGTKLKPVGLVYIGIKKKNEIKIHKYLFKKNDRSKIQKKTVKKALELILRILK